MDVVRYVLHIESTVLNGYLHCSIRTVKAHCRIVLTSTNLLSDSSLYS